MEVEINRAVIVPASKRCPATQIPASTSRKKINNKDRNQKSSELKDSTLCYRMSDVVLSLGVILPLVIAFWRGVWQLMDIYSARWGVDPWLSIGTGYIIPFFLNLLQGPLRSTVHPSRMNFCLFYIISRCLLLVHSFGSVNQWRGLWVLLDIYTGLEGVEGTRSAILSLVVGVFFSVILKTFCNVLAPPLCVFVDEGNTIHDCPLRFKTSPRLYFRYFLDCIFSVVVVSAFVVCCWRGVWNLGDIHLYPENETKSALASLGFGYGLCLIMFIVQPYIHRLETNLSGLTRFIIIDMLIFLQFLGCVFAWRGLWIAYDLLIVFETETISEWVTTIVGAAGAVLFGCVSAVVVRGISIDGEDSGDGLAEWSIPYISLLKTRIYDVPFPEPWVCRYLCTTQKMNIGKDKGKHKHRVHANTNSLKPDYEASSIPLKQSNSQIHRNSVHLEDPLNLRHNRFSDFPNIDSSSEEELGMRASMLPVNTHDDDTTLTQEV